MSFTRPSDPPIAKPGAYQPQAPNPRPPLRRPGRGDGSTSGQGRVLSGAAAGLAAHLRVNPWIIRLLFVLGIPLGVGPFLYLWFWVFVPSGNPWEQPFQSPERSRLASPNQPVAPKGRRGSVIYYILAGLSLIFLALVGFFQGPQLLTQSRPL